MDIFHKVFNRSLLSPSSEKAWKISRRLCTGKHVNSSDIHLLLAIGSDAIEPFRMILAQDADCHGTARREQLVDALGCEVKGAKKHAPTLTALLASFIEDEEGMAGAKAVSYLASYGSQVSNILLKALKTSNSHTRSYAARSLGTIVVRNAIPNLIHALRDDDPRVRSDAAEALGKSKDIRASDPLFKALTDPNWLVRESAGCAIANFTQQEIMDKLIFLMHDTDYRIRMKALHIISGMDSPASTLLLTAALDDAHIEVQQKAAGALGAHHHREALIPLLTHYQQGNQTLRQHIIKACTSIGIKRVASHLTNDDANIRISVAQILEQHGDPEFLPLLANAWQHESNQDVQMWIVVAIGQLATVAGKSSPDVAIKVLVHATKNPHQGISYHARQALESLPHPLAEQFMQQPLQQTKVAITCPNCLQTLHLMPPLAGKKWHCQHCYLGFTVRAGIDGMLVVSPATRAANKTPAAHHSRPWFEVLQVSPDASVSTIKRAFRTLLKQYHPDRVATLGTEFKQLAEEKTILLTWALRTGIKACQQK